jgi:hypothetical protein
MPRTRTTSVCATLQSAKEISWSVPIISLLRSSPDANARQAKCFGDSKTAYSSGDGGRAKNLSSEGKDHQRKKDEFNMQAATWIFTGGSMSSDDS